MAALARWLGGLHDRLVTSLAIVAGLAIWAIVGAILVDVVARNLGVRGVAHTYALVEYGLLLITILGSPWLIRTRGHIFVEIVFHALPPAAQRALSTLVCLVCVVVCLVLFAYSLGETVSAFRRGVMETRSFDFPRWIPLSVFPAGFLLMAVEFLRILLGRDHLHPVASMPHGK
ncbi:TRAP transporter small permease [Faunimonas sp. B44]|uniref:TRAP transporter small permease n=1 Tax=Faunimonas sp. B44 TaxID=3461493 RepID=UPI004044295A